MLYFQWLCPYLQWYVYTIIFLVIKLRDSLSTSCFDWWGFINFGTLTSSPQSSQYRYIANVSYQKPLLIWIYSLLYSLKFFEVLFFLLAKFHLHTFNFSKYSTIFCSLIVFLPFIPWRPWSQLEVLSSFALNCWPDSSPDMLFSCHLGTLHHFSGWSYHIRFLNSLFHG